MFEFEEGEEDMQEVYRPQMHRVQMPTAVMVEEEEEEEETQVKHGSSSNNNKYSSSASLSLFASLNFPEISAPVQDAYRGGVVEEEEEEEHVQYQEITQDDEENEDEDGDGDEDEDDHKQEMEPPPPSICSRSSAASVRDRDRDDVSLQSEEDSRRLKMDLSEAVEPNTNVRGSNNKSRLISIEELQSFLTGDRREIEHINNNNNNSNNSNNDEDDDMDILNRLQLEIDRRAAIEADARVRQLEAELRAQMETLQAEVARLRTEGEKKQGRKQNNSNVGSPLQRPYDMNNNNTEGVPIVNVDIKGLGPEWDEEEQIMQQQYQNDNSLLDPDVFSQIRRSNERMWKYFDSEVNRIKKKSPKIQSNLGKGVGADSFSIFIFRNGDKNDVGTRFVVNEAMITDMKSLLSQITRVIPHIQRPPAKKLFDTNAKEIKELSQIIPMENYIVVGCESVLVFPVPKILSKTTLAFRVSASSASSSASTAVLSNKKTRADKLVASLSSSSKPLSPNRHCTRVQSSSSSSSSSLSPSLGQRGDTVVFERGLREIRKRIDMVIDKIGGMNETFDFAFLTQLKEIEQQEEEQEILMKHAKKMMLKEIEVLIDGESLRGRKGSVAVKQLAEDAKDHHQTNIIKVALWDVNITQAPMFWGWCCWWAKIGRRETVDLFGSLNGGELQQGGVGVILDAAECPLTGEITSVVSQVFFEQVNLKAGDYLVSVGDVDVRGKTVLECSFLLDGVGGSEVDVLVARKGMDSSEDEYIPVQLRLTRFCIDEFWNWEHEQFDLEENDGNHKDSMLLKKLGEIPRCKQRAWVAMRYLLGLNAMIAFAEGLDAL